ncbi:hypothetical protein [Methylorubrum zatmanii]
MRAAALALLALLVPVTASPAGPLDRAGTGRPEGGPILSQPDAAESAARQAEFDRQIAERSNRAARSICAGCNAGTGARGTSVTPALRNPGRDEPRPADPAAAPLD